MAENRFNLFQFPYYPLSTNKEPQGPYYYRSASGVGDDLDNEGKDYYWKESWVDSREREPASDAYFYYYAANMGEPPDGHVSQYNDYRWEESSLSYTQKSLLKLFWGGDVIHNQTYSSIPSSVTVGNSTYHKYAGWTANASGTHYSVYRVVGAGNLPVGTTDLTRKVEVYWKGVKRLETTYEWNGYGLPSYLDEGYTDHKWSHSTAAFKEIVGQDRNTKWYSAVTYQRMSNSFTDTDYNYNLPAKPPKPLVAVDRNPYERHEPGEADYYLFGLRLVRVDDQAGFDQTSKTSAPFAVNCAVSIQFPYIKRVQAGVYEVNQATYNAMRHGTWTGDDRTYVHTLDKTRVQRVRHRYQSNGKYYFRTDQYYASSGVNNFSASDVIYYSDTRYTCHYLGGADFYGYNPAYPKWVNYIGHFDAREGDYIFQRSKPDDWYRIETKLIPDSTFDDFELAVNSPFTNFLGYNDLYYSKQPQPNKFPINWSPPGGVTNFASNYDNYAIYPLYGYKEYRAEFPFDTEPAHQFHGTANNARPGLTGPIAPQQHEVLELNLNREVPATSYIFNKGHHDSGFCVVPYGDGFGFTVSIIQPKDSFLLNVINNHSWHSVTTELTNCTLIGDKNSSYDFTVIPIKTGEHFLCEIKYRNRAQSGGAYVNFHFVVKGFAMPEGGTKTIDINETQNTFLGVTYNISAEEGDVAGDSLINLNVTMSDWQQYTDVLADSPQKLKVSKVENCVVLDDYVYWTPPGGVGAGGPIGLAKPIRILPTADNWKCRIYLYFGWAYVGPFDFDNRYYPDMGMQVWNEAGGTRLNSSSRHPRIIYAHEGVINYPVNLTVPEFMCHFNDVPFVEDMRQHRIQMLNDGNQYDSIHYDDKKFGAACIKIDRSEGAQAFEVAANSDFDFGTGDYTIDFWFKHTDATGTIIDMRIPGGSYSQPGPRIYIDGSNNIKVYINGSNRITCYSYTYARGVWNHFALVRKSGQAKAYVNGFKQGSTYSNSSDVTQRGFRVGTTYDSNGNMGGTLFIDELRILKGNAFYTANFTPASSQYMGNNDVTLDYTDIPELVELVDDGTWHVNLTSEKGLTHVDFDYQTQEVRISKNLPAAGNVRYTSWEDYARFQILRL